MRKITLILILFCNSIFSQICNTLNEAKLLAEQKGKLILKLSDVVVDRQYVYRSKYKNGLELINENGLEDSFVYYISELNINDGDRNNGQLTYLSLFDVNGVEFKKITLSEYERVYNFLERIIQNKIIFNSTVIEKENNDLNIQVFDLIIDKIDMNNYFFKENVYYASEYLKRSGIESNKTKLREMLALAYLGKFKKIRSSFEKMKEGDTENNDLMTYYFLKYLINKKFDKNKYDENDIYLNPNFNQYKERANKILNFYNS